MRIQSAMLCEAAVIVGNKLYVVGGALGSYTAPQFPTRIGLSVALILETEPDLGVTGEVEISVVNDAGPPVDRAVLNATIGDPGVPFAPWLTPAWAKVEIDAQHPGRVEVLLGSEGSIEHRLPIAIVGPA